MRDMFWLLTFLICFGVLEIPDHIWRGGGDER